MNIRLRFFASLREALGEGEGLDVAEGLTVGRLRDQLIARGTPYAEALARGRAVRAALDHALCDDGAVLRHGAEVAFFPPITGG